jgi:hypothetical protein
MSIILYRQDPFAVQTQATAQSFRAGGGIGVRRPLYGYIPKADRYSSISIRQAGIDNSLTPVSISDSGGVEWEGRGWSNLNHNFLIQSVSHAVQEKMQIVETFGQDFVFFFGERSLVLDVRGLLINSSDFPWKSEWLHNYENYLRGTRCVQNRTRVYLHVDDRLYSGYLFQTSVSDSAELPHVCQFGFQMLVCAQVDLTTATVRSFEDTRIVGGVQYVDYIEAPIEDATLTFLDPATGGVKQVETVLATTEKFLTATEALQRVQQWFALAQDPAIRELLRTPYAGALTPVPSGVLRVA